MQRDPIGLQGGLNSYSYCDNQPVSLGDPEGLFPWKAVVIVVALFLVAIMVVKMCQSSNSAKMAAVNKTCINYDRIMENPPEAGTPIKQLHGIDDEMLREGIKSVVENLPGSSVTGQPSIPTNAPGVIKGALNKALKDSAKGDNGNDNGR